MSAGRRWARAVPGLTRRAWSDVAGQLEEFLRSLASTDLGVPSGKTSSVPERIEAGKAASSGSEATGWAAGDHSHAVATAPAVALTTASTNTEGISSRLARADHTHDTTALGSGNASRVWSWVTGD